MKDYSWDCSPGLSRENQILEHLVSSQEAIISNLTRQNELLTEENERLAEKCNALTNLCERQQKLLEELFDSKSQES